jgi:ArsR family transcriptional regulator, arsenate/arsenite/antimonite-responsive transcriptional repressor
MEWTMNSKQVVAALGALAHEHRLSIYRLLVEAGPQGLNAGTIATRLKLASSSLTFHVQHLHRAGLIAQQRKSRELIYSTDCDFMNGLVGYLTENCCGGAGKAASACETSCAPVRVPKKTAKKAARAA